MKKIKYLILLVILSLLFLNGCDSLSSSDEANANEIKTIVDEIQTSFLNSDIETVMTYYHENFMNNNYFKQHQEVLWYEYSTEYNSFQINDFEVVFDDNTHATAFFEIEFSASDTLVSFQAPSEFSSLSYFYKELDTWKIYGNQSTEGEAPTYNLDIESEPPGAFIYLNDSPIYQITPTTLYSVPNQDTLNIRLYLYQYNEWDTTIVVPNVTKIEKNLKLPGYPRPRIEISSPEDEDVFNVDTINLLGEITLLNSYGHEDVFENGEFIITLNSKEFYFNTALGEINQLFHIENGPNILRIRATSDEGHTGWSEQIVFYGDY